MPPAGEAYGLAPGRSGRKTPTPELPCAPIGPRRYRPVIALVGCGEISVQHLRVCSGAGCDAAVLCYVMEEMARACRDAFFPRAEVCMDWRALPRRGDVEAVSVGLGIAKVNVASELAHGVRGRLQEQWGTGVNLWTPPAIAETRAVMEPIVEKRIRITGAAGKVTVGAAGPA